MVERVCTTVESPQQRGRKECRRKRILYTQSPRTRGGFGSKPEELAWGSPGSHLVVEKKGTAIGVLSKMPTAHLLSPLCSSPRTTMEHTFPEESSNDRGTPPLTLCPCPFLHSGQGSVHTAKDCLHHSRAVNNKKKMPRKKAGTPNPWWRPEEGGKGNNTARANCYGLPEAGEGRARGRRRHRSAGAAGAAVSPREVTSGRDGGPAAAGVTRQPGSTPLRMLRTGGGGWGGKITPKSAGPKMAAE